ncbi:PAS domain S-box protein [Thermodesulfobacteriota bacterium]
MSKKPTCGELEKKLKNLEEFIEEQKKNKAELLEEIKELKQIQAYYNILMENTQDYIVICDSNGVSQAFNTSYKKRGEELLKIKITPGMKPHKLSGIPEAVKYWDSLQSRVLKGEKFVEESHFKEFDKYFETIFCPVKEGQEIKWFTEITRDITERQKAIEDLNKSKIKLENIINSLPLGVFIYKLENDNRLIFTGTNPAASKILNVDCSQFIGKTIEEAFPPLAQTEIPAKYREVCRDGISWYTEQLDYDYSEIKGAYEVHAFQSEPETGIIVFQDITERKQNDEVLNKLQTQLSNAMEMARLGHWEYDVAADTFTFNEQFYMIFGSKAEEVGGYKMKSEEFAKRFLHPDDVRLVREETEKAIETDDPNYKQRTECRINYADGTEGHMSVQINIIKDEKGNTIKTYGVNQNITELKKVEKELSYRLEFEHLVSKISSELAGTHSKEEIDVQINRALASIGKFSGADRAYVFHYYGEKIIADNTHEWCNDGIQPEIENLQGIYMEKELPWFLKNLKEKDLFYVPDVSAMPPEARLEQQHYNSQGIKSIIVVPLRSGSKLIGSLGFDSVREKKEWSDDDLILLKFVGETLTNVIERVHSEEMLKEKSAFLDRVIESSALSTWIADEKGTAIRANPACLDFFGATEDEVIGKYNLFSDSVLQAQGFMAIIKDVFEKGKPASILIDYDFSAADHVDVKNAAHKIINSIFTPILNGKGRVTNVIVQAVDLTEIKEMEAELIQSRKMESIGTLAGGIAHEFNNILGIIIGNTELAIEDIPDYNPALDCVKEIREASIRAKDVVRQIMSFARKTPADRIPLQIRTVIRDSLNMLRSTIPKSIKIDEEILCTSENILGNKTEINQILMNLFTNSLHSLKEETGLIKVILEPVSLDDLSASGYENLEAGEYVKLAVKDTGEGIDPLIIDRVLDPYFTTKDVDKGLGMGLAVVYGIMKKHDGAIQIMSELGEGTTIEMLFPVSDAKVEEEVKRAETLSTGTEHILFVDDEPSIVKIAVRILEKQGYDVTGLTSSTEALELFQKDPGKFNLIITDMSMPEMPGDKLIKEVIKVRSNIPIILSSGHSDHINEDVVKELGIAAYAMKPLIKEQLLKTVREVLDKAKG